MLSIDVKFMLDEKKLQFLTWCQAAWHHGRYGSR